jgi:serine O-acetyltransferase
MYRNKFNLFVETKSDFIFLRGFCPNLRQLISAFIFNPGFRALTIFRLQDFLISRGNFRFGLVISNLNLILSGIEICAGARIESPSIIRHPNGIVIGGGAVIGKGVVLLQGVTIGQANVHEDFSNSGPIVGDNVTIGANSSILGEIFIANGTKIGAHSLVLNSTVENGTYIGSPAKLINGGSRNE